MPWGDNSEHLILERIAVAQEATLAEVQTIAEKQTAIEQHQATMVTQQATIVEHLAAIKEYQRCICECCTSGAMRSELLIETTMENSEKPAAERYALYEQELSEAGGS